MIDYLLKTIICSAWLFLLYFLLLRKEKIYHYNRFYLLFSLAFSFFVPFITITFTSPLNTITAITRLPGTINTTPLQEVYQAEKHNYLFTVLLIIYVLITTVLLFRFIKNLFSICLKIQKNKVIRYAGAYIVLLEENTDPHSFLNYIFLNRELYEQGKIEKEILEHELAHIRQKHSLDILLLELLLAFTWFNPFLYLYKKAALLNHEFLSDESVLQKFNDRPGYQYLLLTIAARPDSLPLTNSFNYLLIKKRFLMMTKQTSPVAALARKLALLPLLCITGFLFSSTVVAQEVPATAKKLPPQAESTQEGVSQQLLDEYHALINKYKTDDPKWFLHLVNTITPADQLRLETIFRKMSIKQQAKEEVVFTPPGPPFEKLIPTSKQLESFNNGAVYGVWIDNKRISNDKLGSYSPNDFSHVFVSRLAKNAKNYGKHYYQVDLMTNAYYEEYYKRAMARKRYYIAHALKSLPVQK